ncbi:hypothetical protein IEU95_01140 [Hoyosella rhizosphaerae]|uniref:DUF6875 domain-containing protein n=1 Tax=Hoyosella rhizosphaerae TaxID=1755582 RepID=A0A916XIW2_9ACTN|nr:hypothetical protein [Hoyosella rhizosphaerae]MBN4925423.1 hypothetical protein [Hoyosella rhizosphaerae]GGC75303.1 hypothetical protein GCM10011410_30780 [Hoyosella rhizosphaerae]
MTAVERAANARAGRDLVNLSNVDMVAADPVLTQLLDWVQGFLTRPHVDLGRSGPVCPFTVPSLNRELLWASVVAGDHLSADDIASATESMVDEFLRLESSGSADSLYKAAMVVFPDVTDFDLIDQVQRAGKSRAVENGMMLGQFYPGCAEPGLWNADFRPLDCPLPMIALRHMVPSDFPFLVNDPEWLSSYLKRFAPSVPAQVRSTMVDRLLTQRD